MQHRRPFIRTTAWLAAACCGAAMLGAAAAAPMRLAFAPAAPAGVAATAAAAPAASAASAARPAASAASAPAPAVPAAAASVPRPPASAASAPAAANTPVSMAGGSSSLHLLVNPVPLPQGHVGVPYKRVRIVLEGVSPYSITVEGSLPQGMSLSENGYLGGTPTVAGLSRFVVRASDSATPPTVAQQVYVLRVATPSRTPAKPASSPASAPAPLSALTPDDAKTLPAKVGGSVSAWQLTQADLDLLVPDPNAPAPAAPEAQGQAPAPLPPASSPPKEEVITDAAQAAADAEAAQMAQLRQMLLPLLQAEYPSRQLFESALDAQLCAHVKALIAQAERSKGLPQSGGAGVVCPPPPPPPGAPAKGAPRPSTPAATTTTIPLSQLPTWLLPPSMRADLVSIAEKRHPLDAAKPVQWTDGNCGCVHEDMVAEVYGFYPFWAAAGKPQQLNFSLLTRISTHAATFTDDGTVLQPASWGATADFAVEAQRHGTRLDLVVWRNDWKSLLVLDEQRLERTARDLARNAVAAADMPLRDQASRWKRLLPFYASDPRLADGITVFFDGAPTAATDPAGAKAFTGFVRRFMLALITQMREGAPRNYVLNVAMPSTQMGTAPYDLDALFDYVKRAEEPRVDHQRIQEEGDIYRSRTNVTIRFVALLPEPTTQSKKTLRKTLEDSRVILGNDRRVLLRKIVPVISYTGADPQQFADDLAYFRDNFGGAGFWQVPQDGVGPGTGMYDAIARAFRKDASDETSPVCKIVCTQRWAVRAAFQLLVVVLLLGLVGVAAAGGMRCAGRQVVLGLLAVAALVVLTGGGLLNCDPEFRTLREGNSLFWTVLLLLFVAALFATLKPRDPRP